MKASEIMFDESIAHGTKDGYEAGCKGSHCMGVERLGMSCRQASVRYASDLSYRRRIDGGLSPEAIWAEDQLEQHEVPPAPDGKTGSLAHATPSVSFADSRTPIDADLGETAAELSSDPIAYEMHGTNKGYSSGCRAKDLCPGVERVGVSCTQAASAARALRRGSHYEKEGTGSFSGTVVSDSPLVVIGSVASPEVVEAAVPVFERVRAGGLLSDLADAKEQRDAAFARINQLESTLSDERAALVDLGSRLLAEKAEHGRIVLGLQDQLMQVNLELDVEKARVPGRTVTTVGEFSLDVTPMAQEILVEPTPGGGVRLRVSGAEFTADQLLELSHLSGETFRSIAQARAGLSA